MSQEITIVVDENDADYLTKVSKIFEEELLTILPLIKAIKKFNEYAVKGEGRFVSRRFEHNYPVGEMLRKDLGEKSPRELYKFDEEVFDVFEGFCPSSEHGFHSIISVEVCPIQKKTRLL